VMGECVCETIGVPSKLSVIRKTSVLSRMELVFDLSCEENTTRSPHSGGSGTFVYYESIKRELKIRPMRVSV